MRADRRGYVLRRTARSIAIVFVAISLNFMLFRAIPGDVSTSFGSLPGATKAVKDQVRKDFDLDQPLAGQYVTYWRQLLRGNLGVSYRDHLPVRDKVMHSLKNTVPLVLAAVALAAIAGIWLGVFAAWRRGSPVDHLLGVAGIAAYAAPIQWLGLMLILGFSGWFASGGMSDPFLIDTSWWARTVDYLRHLALPCLTLAISLFGTFFIVTRSAVAETLGEEYMQTARAKGLRAGRLRRRYALRNAALPITTLVGLSLGYVAGGAVLVETVFSWPGIGRALYEAVNQRDYAMLQGGFLVLTLSVVLATYVIDMLHLKLDPRVGRSS